MSTVSDIDRKLKHQSDTQTPMVRYTCGYREEPHDQTHTHADIHRYIDRKGGKGRVSRRGK